MMSMEGFAGTLPFGGQPGRFPYSRLVARQCGKRRKLRGLQGSDKDI